MRIWSLHPAHLDRMGLLACWRETLLAQAVLAGRTAGYLGHPQLERFRAQADPLESVGAYLGAVASDATARGYRFNEALILRPAKIAAPGDAFGGGAPIPVTQGQLELEWQHLGRKLQERSPEYADRWAMGSALPHPLFRVVQGGVESWERARLPSGVGNNTDEDMIGVATSTGERSS